MAKSLLTVCLITYNHAEYIKQSVDSILEQEANFAWQLIIADDCSTDGTRDILEDYQKKYPERIRLILQKKNVGPEANWTDLLAAAQTKYVLYGEGDDYFTNPTKLQKQVDFLEEHPDFSICFHPVDVVYDDGSHPTEIFPTPEQRFNKTVLMADDLLARNFMQTNSVMYRWQLADRDIRKVLPKNIAPGDWYLHLYYAQLGKIGFINKVMSVYRRHSGGLWWNTHKDRDEVWKKHGVGHMVLYAELLKAYGNTSNHRSIIDRHIEGTVNILNRIDDEYKTGLMQSFTEKFPGLSNIILLSLSRTTYANYKSSEVLNEKLRMTTEELREAAGRAESLELEREADYQFASI